MPIRVLVNGAAGKMGQETVKAVQNDPALQLIGQTEKSDDLVAAIKANKAEVVIDFTSPTAAYDNALAILSTTAKPVIGTTGFTKDQIGDLSQRCKQLKRGAVIAPNFSIGAVLMMEFAKQAARYYSHAEIIEYHHAGKKDAPSGTAIKTAEMIAESCKQAMKVNPIHETLPGSRGANSQGIAIHAVRLPGVMAAEDVIFGELGETLTIRHNTIDRAAFMSGVLLACKKVMELDYLVYGLEKLL